MTQALYRKWRPASWEEVVAQEHIVQTLQNAVATDRVAHAYLFAGPRGTGKTTCARLLAKAVNCLDEKPGNRPCNQCKNCIAVNEGRFMDLIEIDAASNTSVDDVRDLRDKITFSPSQGQFKVYIIDEVHMLSTSAFNALLKTLEEPPSHVIFILATTEIHKIPATVLSRCQRYEFRRIPIQMIISKLKDLCKEEGIEIQEETLSMIARQSTGSMRDAISLIDQLSSMSKQISLETAQEMMGTATNQAVLELMNALVEKDHASGLGIIHKTLDAGGDPRQFGRQIVDYLRSVLLVKMGLGSQTDAPADIRKSMTTHAAQIPVAELIQAINAFSAAATDLKANWHPGLGLELAFTQLAIADPTLPTTKSEPTAQVAVPESPNVEKEIPVKKKEKASHSSSQVEQTTKAAELPKPQKVSEKLPEPVLPVVEGEKGLPLVQQYWKTIKEAVRQLNPKTEGLINSANLFGFKDNTLILSFNSEVVKNMMLKDNHIQILSKALNQVLGKEIKISCIYGKHARDSMAPNVDFDADGMVGTAMRDLGGKITDVKKK
jgi:DNA polymerase-3 subunit gamma/tau